MRAAAGCNAARARSIHCGCIPTIHTTSAPSTNISSNAKSKIHRRRIALGVAGSIAAKCGERARSPA